MKTISILIVSLLIMRITSMHAQGTADANEHAQAYADSIINAITTHIKLQDPLRNHKYFIESGFELGMTDINRHHATFNTSDGTYQFNKNLELPSSDIMMNFGRLWYDKDNDVNMLKIGIDFAYRGAYVTTPGGNTKQYSDGLLEIPIMWGWRQPIRHKAIHNNMYRALDWNLGLYGATNVEDRLAGKNALWAPWNYNTFNNLRLGFVVEIAFSEFNKHGKGYRIGLRTSGDIAGLGMTKFSDTKYQLYPYYLTSGIFYDFGGALHK